MFEPAEEESPWDVTLERAEGEAHAGGEGRLIRVESVEEAWGALEALDADERRYWGSLWIEEARRTRVQRKTYVLRPKELVEQSAPGSRRPVDWERSLEDGVRMETLLQEPEPVLEVIFDRSRSIEFDQWIESLGLLFDWSLHGLLPWMRIWTFSGGIQQVRSEEGPTQMARSILNSGPRGFTDIEQALRWVSFWGRGPILLLSDGRVTAGKDPRAMELKHRQVFSYQIGADEEGRRLLEEVCKRHGGAVFSSQSLREMLDTIREIVLGSLCYER